MLSTYADPLESAGTPYADSLESAGTSHADYPDTDPRTNADADTYVIRRADKAVWVVLQTGNGDGGILVAEGPLPDAPAE